MARGNSHADAETWLGNEFPQLTPFQTFNAERLDNMTAEPFSLGIEGECWEPQLNSLVIPVQPLDNWTGSPDEKGVILVAYSPRNGGYLIIRALTAEVHDDLLMTASVVRNMVETIHAEKPKDVQDAKGRPRR